VDAIWRDAIDTELEVGSKEERRVEKEARGDHGTNWDEVPQKKMVIGKKKKKKKDTYEKISPTF
jgi:hypothetical protein